MGATEMKERVIEKIVKTIAVPHDWTVNNWPRDIYPYDGAKARHILRVHQTALIEAGALTRIGRQIVVQGAGYSRWMAQNAGNVVEFAETKMAPNREEHADKRFDHGRKRGRWPTSKAT